MYITINIRGQIFKATEDTLLESSYMVNKLKDHDKQKELFINEDPFFFDMVLKFLTVENYIFPIDLIRVLDYYGVEYEGVVKCHSNKCSRKIDPEDVYCDFCKRGFIHI